MKKFNIIVVILLLASFWMNYSLITQVDYLKNEVRNMSNNLSHAINNTHSSINRMNNEIEKKALWINDKNYEIVDVDDTYSTYKIDLNFCINNLENDEDLYVILINQQDQSQQKISVPKSESLTYSVNLELSDNDYKLNLLGVSKDNSRTEYIDIIGLKSLKNRIVNIYGEKLSTKVNSKNNELTMDFFLFVSNEPKKMLPGLSSAIKDIEFASITADIYIANDIIGEIDFINEKGYVPKDLSKITNKTPEFYYEYVKKVSDANKSEHTENFFAGTLTVSGEDFDKLKEMENHYEDLYFLVRVVDINGNEFKYVFGSHFYEFIDGEIVKLF